MVSGQAVSGQWPGSQWSAVSGQWSVVSGQRSVVSGQWSAVSGQWSAVSGQWSVVSERREARDDADLALDSKRCRIVIREVRAIGIGVESHVEDRGAR